MKRGGWVVILLVGIVIGFVAGVGAPQLGILESIGITYQSSTDGEPTGSADGDAVPEGSGGSLTGEESGDPATLKPLEQAEWLAGEFFPAAAIAYATVDIPALVHTTSEQPGIGAFLGAEGLARVWEAVATQGLGPAGGKLLPLIPMLTSLDVFLLPASNPAVQADIMIHAGWPDPDLTLLMEDILEPLASMRPESVTIEEEIGGFPLRGLESPDGGLFALADSGGVWVANHREMLENMVAEKPSEATSTVGQPTAEVTASPSDRPPESGRPPKPGKAPAKAPAMEALLTGTPAWLTIVIRRPPGDIPPEDPLAWLWGAPWNAVGARLEAGESQEGSTIAASLIVGPDAPSSEIWPSAFSSTWRPPASLGRIALSLPVSQARTGQPDSGSGGDERERRRQMRREDRPGGERPGGDRSGRRRGGDSFMRGGREGMSRFFEGRSSRMRMFPPIGAIVIDIVNTGADDPPWLAHLPDPDGEITKWFTRLSRGQGPMAETVWAEEIRDGAATAFEFEEGPFLHWLGTSRLLVTTAEGEVLVFEDEAVLDELPALIVPGPTAIPKDEQQGSNGDEADPPAPGVLAYADMSPELIKAMVAFQAGGNDAAVELVKILDPFVDSMCVSAERNGPQLTMRSKAPTGPANLIGIAVLISAAQMLLAG